METVILKHYYLERHLMISKKKINQIKSLTQKKARRKEQLFLAEGDKIVLEVLNSPIRVKEIIATEDFVTKYKLQISRAESVIVSSLNDIAKASLLKSPQNSLALCHLPPATELPEKLSGLSFYLDGIQDPGNLGTLIRLCDWFGIEYLFCSPDTADLYNPKVIQSSMGSFCRIKAVYTVSENLLLLASRSKIPVFGTFMDGKSLYSAELASNALIVMGNEGNGIRPAVAEKIINKLSIPSFSTRRTGAESLNVAVAAGIIAGEFRRKMHEYKTIQNESSG